MATLRGYGKAKISDLLNDPDDFEYIAFGTTEIDSSPSIGPEVDAFFESISSDVENMKVVEQMRNMGYSEERIKSMVFNAVRCDDGNDPSE